MRRFVIAVLASLVLLFLATGSLRPGSFGYPGVSGPFGAFLPYFASGFLAIILDRWASGRRQIGVSRERAEPACTNVDDARIEDVTRDLDRTARNLEKRLEALETILLDRTRTAR